jgi:pyruvate/2-oxoglutarate/acetoin dehydrogenase E1 component
LNFAAFGAEVVAQIMERSPGALKALRRLASPEHPIPSCGPLEKLVLPGTGHVVAAIRELCTS